MSSSVVTKPIADFAIVGGGIVGSALAHTLLTRFATRRVVLMDKETRLGLHQSSHNSGVIHAGVYYAPGSLRARLCVDGAKRMYAFANAHNIHHRRCGKLIVALREDELARLDTLHQRAKANGVVINAVSPDQVRQIEPSVTGAIAALHSPDSGVINYGHVVSKLEELIRDHSGGRGSVKLSFELVAAHRTGDVWHLRSAAGEEVTARFLITCAGLQSDRVAQLCGAPSHPTILPVRGEWRILKEPHNDLVRGLIYPVPDPKFPFLGVHFTRRIDGSVLVGPNAILATSREGYSLTDVRLSDVADMLRHSSVRSLIQREIVFGAGELMRSLSRRVHMRELSAYIPALQANHMTSEKLSGVRAQAMTLEGKLYDDFILDLGPHTLHIRNAPSPAATASLAIADHLATQIQAQIGLHEQK